MLYVLIGTYRCRLFRSRNYTQDRSNVGQTALSMHASLLDEHAPVRERCGGVSIPCRWTWRGRVMVGQGGRGGLTTA